MATGLGGPGPGSVSPPRGATRLPAEGRQGWIRRFTRVSLGELVGGRGGGARRSPGGRWKTVPGLPGCAGDKGAV